MEQDFNCEYRKRQPYASPSMKVIEVAVQRVLCGSTEQYNNENNYNPWLNN